MLRRARRHGHRIRGARNAARLFESSVALDLEGIVAKRRSDPYDGRAEWRKVKHAGYSQNEGRWELFKR